MVNRRWKVIVCTFWFLWFLIFGAVQLPGFTLAYLVFIDVFLLCVCVICDAARHGSSWAPS